MFVQKYGNVLEATRNSLRVYNWIKATLPSSLVNEDILPLVTQQILPDPADDHVLQAATISKANVIVTDNTRHFPEYIVSSYGIVVKMPDEVIAEIIGSNWDRSMLIIKRMHNRFQNPAIPWKEFLGTCQTQHSLPRTAERIRQGRPQTT